MVDLERIVPLKPGGAATPLFCVHAGSGSAYTYLDLARLLDADRPVYGIEAPGFDNDREPVRSLPALSTEYSETLRELRPEGDFVLLGWSLGGVIAFDVAQRLSAAGSTVRQVVLIDVGLPLVEEVPPEKEIVRWFLRDVLATTGTPPAALETSLAGQPDEATGEALLLAAERSGALPAEFEAELLTDRYAVFRAHFEASCGFAVTEPYHGPVVHLIASGSPRQHMRWDTVATDLTEHTLPGDHHSIWLGENLPRLAGLVSAAVAAPAGGGPGPPRIR